MKNFCRLITLLVLCASITTSCKKSVPKQTQFIPKSASFVATINTGSLQRKMGNSETSIEKIAKDLSGDNDTALNKGKAEWEAFKNSGVDLGENMYMWVAQKGGGNITTNNTGSAVFSIVAVLNNAGKLEAYIRQKDPSLQIQKEKDYSFVTKDGDKMVAWGKDVVIMMTYQQSYTGGMVYDSVTGSYNLQTPGDANLVNQLKTEMNASFNQQEAASVASIAEFRELANDKSDVGFWVNSSSSMDAIPFPLPKLNALLENSYTAATLNFEEGKVVMNSKSYTSKALKDILKKHPGTDADFNLVERFPSNNINGFMLFSFDPQIINSIVQYMEVGAMANGFLTRFMGQDYTLNDALKAIKGQVAVVISDFEITRSDTTAMPGMRSYSQPKAKVVINIPVGDKVQMNRMMERLAQMNFVTRVNGRYQPSGILPGGFTAIVDDQNMLLASSNELLTAYRANTAKATLKNGIVNDLKGKPASVYFDLQSILTAVNARQTNSNNDIFPLVSETFNDVKGYLDDFNGDYNNAHFELRLKNEKENSLATLIGFASKVSEVAKRNRQPNSVVYDFKSGTDTVNARP